MNRIYSSIVLSLLTAILMFGSVLAQDDGLTISIRRDFGYSSGGSDIQGLFSITATGSVELSRVIFYVDEIVIGESSQAPYKTQFNTDKFSNGQHKIHAVGITPDNQKINSREITANFVSAKEGWQSAMKVAIPILAVSLLAVLFSAILPIITGRKTADLPAGAERTYPFGGAICPKCGRPFAVHIYGVNLLVYKFDRCPYCGKWSLVRRSSIDKLKAAEQAELAKVNEKAQVAGMSAEEKLARELDDSKFHDL